MTSGRSYGLDLRDSQTERKREAETETERERERESETERELLLVAFMPSLICFQSVARAVAVFTCCSCCNTQTLADVRTYTT